MILDVLILHSYSHRRCPSFCCSRTGYLGQCEINWYLDIIFERLGYSFNCEIILRQPESITQPQNRRSHLAKEAKNVQLRLQHSKTMIRQRKSASRGKRKIF
jgi:hypothetical protein